MYSPRGTFSFIARKHSTCWLLEISQNDMVQHTCFFVCQHIAKIDLLKKTPTNLSFKYKYTYTVYIYIIKYIYIILVFHPVLSHEAAFFLAPASWLAPCFPAAHGNEIPSSHSKPLSWSWRVPHVALHFVHFLVSNESGFPSLALWKGQRLALALVCAPGSSLVHISCTPAEVSRRWLARACRHHLHSK